MAASPPTPERRTSSDSTLDVERDGAHAANGHSQGPTAAEATSEGAETTPAGSNPSPGAPEAGDPEAGRTKSETILVVGALCLALFLAALDTTIITTAVPTIANEFHSSQGYIWIGSAYLLGNAAFVPTWGKISDIFGRKPVLLAAAVIFWIGSLLCAVSNGMPMLIASRAIQGIGGGGLIVLPNIAISDLFSMRNRGMYFGILGMVWALASAVGPILGGVFTSQVPGDGVSTSTFPSQPLP